MPSMHAVALHFMHYNFGRIHKKPARDASDASRRFRCVVNGRDCFTGTRAGRQEARLLQEERCGDFELRHYLLSAGISRADSGS